MEPHHPKNRKKHTHSYRNAGNKTGSKVTNDATGEIAAEASDGAGGGASAGVGGGSRRWACTHHPTRGQPPPPPATAPTAAPITTACDNFFATLTAACSALEARAPTVNPAQALRWSITLWGSESLRAGSERSRFWPGRAWSHLRRLSGDSSSESCCCSLQQQWQHSAMAPMTGCDPSKTRPQSLGLLEGDSLLNAAPATTCDLHVTYGVPWGA